jgi:hypothetical protein
MVDPIVTKTCYRCKVTKPISEFHKCKPRKDGLQPDCKACACKVAMDDYYRRRASHPVLSFAGTKFCPKCKTEKPKKDGFARNPGSPDRLAGWCKTCQVSSGRRIKYETLLYYCGGSFPFCNCCGERRIEFLTLDHIHGGGTKHRQETRKSGVSYYSMLKKQGYPPGFQTLCDNCNRAKGHYGHCPHTCTHASH